MTCPTGKVRYRTELDAMLALASTGRGSKWRRQETRHYRCPKCKGWHLTSAPLRAKHAHTSTSEAS